MIRKYLDGGATKADDGKANVAMPLDAAIYIVKWSMNVIFTFPQITSPLMSLFATDLYLIATDLDYCYIMLVSILILLKLGL